jgi:hypothetical protein
VRLRRVHSGVHRNVSPPAPVALLAQRRAGRLRVRDAEVREQLRVRETVVRVPGTSGDAAPVGPRHSTDDGAPVGGAVLGHVMCPHAYDTGGSYAAAMHIRYGKDGRACVRHYLKVSRAREEAWRGGLKI